MADSKPFDTVAPIFEMRTDHSFSANSRGIIEKKAEFFDESREFLLLRKGEDVGAELIGALSAGINALNDVGLSEALKEFVVYSAAVDRIKKFYDSIGALIENRKKPTGGKDNSSRTPLDFRILCSPDLENTEAKSLYEAQGYEVRGYENELQKGPLRFYLNEKRYCLFIRTGGDVFTGTIGDDTDTINDLKQYFEKEWGSSKSF